MLTDWPFEDLNSMMDVTQKYSGRGSYWEPIVPILSSFMQNYTTLDRHFCFPGSHLSKYAAPNNCSLSWMTMIVNAGERALAIANIHKRLSYQFVLKCYRSANVCRGINMRDAEVGLNTIGLVSEEEANRVLEDGGDICDIPMYHRFFFEVRKPEGPNRGGLMNLVKDNDPVLVLLALDLAPLRFVKDMREEESWIRGTVQHPSLYALLIGYNTTSDNAIGSSKATLLLAKLPI